MFSLFSFLGTYRQISKRYLNTLWTNSNRDRWLKGKACAIFGAGITFSLVGINLLTSASAKSGKLNLEKNQVFRIVLTGGPCGGKTTALARIMEYMISLGYRVYTVPEAATLLLGAGCQVGNTPEHLYSFETNLILTQIALEDRFMAIASATGEASIIVCDRGIMDVQAYVPPSMWKLILDQEGWTPVQMRDKRYDGVLHLVTAAIGAEKYYTTANNSVRKESIEEARSLDRKILEAWIGHPKIRIIDNSTSFEDKVQRVVQSICEIVGAPVPLGSEHRFLVSNIEIEKLPSHIEQFSVELTYLHSQDQNTSARLKRREQNSVSSYTYSHRFKKDGDVITLERPLTGREYMALFKQVDASKSVVRKYQTCFVWEGQSWTLNHYTEPKQLYILETNAQPGAQLNLPPFLHVEREVTEELEFSGHGLAKLI